MPAAVVVEEVMVVPVVPVVPVAVGRVVTVVLH